MERFTAFCALIGLTVMSTALLMFSLYVLRGLYRAGVEVPKLRRRLAETRALNAMLAQENRDLQALVTREEKKKETETS